ncbi:MAG TPA: cytidylate kinase-like family protein [Bryobacteraceae bacterium]|nr:cytidylate kinase-like family protein [Bryobacteraceae bacterium]
MIRVITIDREYGSGGPDIAKKLADRLGWKLWDQLLTEEIARLMDCETRVVEEREERKDPLRYRLFKSFMRGSLEGSLNAPRLKMVDAECIREYTQRTVTNAAKTGNSVIVGRGSAYYLHERPEVFHVFIYAPIEEKIQRLQKTGKSEAEAIELVETVDRDRAAYIKQYFDLEWPARHLFHLMINSTLGDDRVVQTIVDSVALLEKRSA